VHIRTQLQIALAPEYHMKIEEFKIFSVKYVRHVIRVGLKSLIEELEGSLLTKPNNEAQF